MKLNLTGFKNIITDRDSSLKSLECFEPQTWQLLRLELKVHFVFSMKLERRRNFFRYQIGQIFFETGFGLFVILKNKHKIGKFLRLRLETEVVDTYNITNQFI